MQFTTLALTALSAAVVLAQDVKVHVVKVSGTTSNALTFTPSNLTANVGDMVQFQFGIGNHSVVQSAFDSPCIPLENTSNTTGIYSGYMPVQATDTNAPTFTIPIANSNPMWLYCSQGKHCQNGMVMVINENTAKNASRSLTKYIAAAKTATQNLAPAGSATNGTSGTNTVTGGSTSGSGSTTTTGGAPAASNTTIPSAGERLYAPGLAGVLAMGAVLLF